MNTQTASTWQPLEDLSDELKMRHQEDLASLAEIWKEQSQRLRDSDALRVFNEKLCREWAIETGVIEGLYSIDRGITQLLIEKGIEASLIPHGSTDRPVSDIVPILEAQKDTLDGIFDFVAQRRPLSTSYIKELHQSLTRHQQAVDAVNSLGYKVKVPFIRGDWKTQPNSPTRQNGSLHEYCPPEHVAAEMDRLVALHRDHVDKDVEPEVDAAWLHHRFTQIHPFQDGNGRVARALASLVFLRAGWFPLVINRDVRDEYIRALETADRGDLDPLIELFSKLQQNAFVRALSLSEDALKQMEPLEWVIATASAKIRSRKYAEYQAMQATAFQHVSKLETQAEQQLREVCDRLGSKLGEIDRDYNCSVHRSNKDNSFWFKKQIVEIAQRLGYYADTRSYRGWVRLRIREERQTDMVVTFHSLGTQFLGVMAASAFLEHRDVAEGEEATVEGPYPLCNEVFQFSYRESLPRLSDRFQKWLGQAILVGMELWQRQL